MLFHDENELPILYHSAKDRALTGDPPIPIDLQRYQSRLSTIILIIEHGTRASTPCITAEGAIVIYGLQLRPSHRLAKDLEIGQGRWL
jgi:hypothetical protein